MREQIEELERSLSLEQSYIATLKVENDELLKQTKGMSSHITDLQHKQRWLQRVIECLVSPDDNKRVF